jgi:hypothetical protein
MLPNIGFDDASSENLRRLQLGTANANSMVADCPGSRSLQSELFTRSKNLAGELDGILISLMMASSLNKFGTS